LEGDSIVLKGEAQVQQLIDNALDNFLAKPQNSHKRQVGTYWIGEIPWCMKKIWWKFKEKVPVSKDLLRKFKTGDIFQDFLEVVLKSWKNDIFLLESERSMSLCPWSVDDDIKITGRLDDLVILKWKDGGERTLFEVKATGMLPTKVRKEYVMQIMPYLRVMGIPRGFIVYGHPNTLQIKVFEVQYDKVVMQKVLDRVRKIDHHVRTDTLPDEGPSYDWECPKCAYRSKCWPMWKKDKNVSKQNVGELIKDINEDNNTANNNNNINDENKISVEQK